MHDVERQLSIVDAGTIHAKLHTTRSSHLRGKHRGFAEHNHATLAKSENNSLGPARGGNCSLRGNLDLHRRRTGGEELPEVAPVSQQARFTAAQPTTV